MSLHAALVRKSSLTEAQLESLISYVMIKRHEMRYREAAASRSKGPVTIGSYYRTVLQGRDQVRKSIVTVLVALSIGLVKPDDVRRLFELVGRGNTELPDVDRKRFVEVLQELLDKIVM